MTTEEIPSGECPHGHREAAFDFMMYGIRPSEPCPKCGEIPEFSDLAMSLDFNPDGPVRGVDGQQYEACPQCGEDSLELEGASLEEWGWTIACWNCDWEIKQAERLDILQYCHLMEEVKSRVESIDQFMEMSGISTRTRVESICLQLRMVLELIVFSSLVSNKDVWLSNRKELQSSQNISRKLMELKRIHTNFYPKPVDQDESCPQEEPTERTKGFLTEAKLSELYGRLGNILHADNPMGRGVDYRYFIDSLPEWMSEVMSLLDCHKVYLFHRPDEFYLIKMSGDVDGELLWVRFRTTPERKTKCAWPDCVSSSARQYCEYTQRFWSECQLLEIEPEQTLAKRIAKEYDSTFL